MPYLSLLQFFPLSPVSLLQWAPVLLVLWIACLLNTCMSPVQLDDLAADAAVQTVPLLVLLLLQLAALLTMTQAQTIFLLVRRLRTHLLPWTPLVQLLQLLPLLLIQTSHTLHVRCLIMLGKVWNKAGPMQCVKQVSGTRLR